MLVHVSKTIVVLLLVCFARVSKAQNKNALFLNLEYQPLKYTFYTIGFGYQPRKNYMHISRSDPQNQFIGYTLNFTKGRPQNDWGLSFQSIISSGDIGNPILFGAEVNYRRINQTNYLGCKPLIGLSFPYFNLAYAHQTNLWRSESGSTGYNQHEFIMGFKFVLLKRRYP